MRDADERGDNRYLEWRSKRRDITVAWATKADTTCWSMLHDFVQFTHNNLEEIKEDKKIIDERDPYRADGEAQIL